MTIARAIRLATEAMRLEVKRHAFDANVLDKLRLATPESVKASKRRKDLLEAIATLQTVAETSKAKTTRTSDEKTLQGQDKKE